ncbi:MAG: PQQ-like beta-propeller repeat protein, partial [Calditrichaeota bacterium]|nr:PQQ-like beta-propeller repeat protein [Calditrichota bacterium]
MKFLLVILSIFLISCSDKQKNELSAEFIIAGIAILTNSNHVSVMQAEQEISLETERFGPYLVAKLKWQPNLIYQIRDGSRIIEVQSPLSPSPLKVTEIILDDLKQNPEGNFPDADVALSTDNSLVAVGTFYGFIQVFSLTENKLLWKKKIAEGMVKKCLFSADSKQLYVGEQSIESNIYAFNAVNGELIWQKNLSDDIGSAPPAKGDNPYFMYSYPGIFHMQLDRQDLIVTAVHSWRLDGKSMKKSKLYSFKPNGQINWQFPQKDALNANIKYFDISDSYLVFNIDGFDSREINGAVKENSMNLIDLRTGALLDSKSVPVFSPHFNSIFFWQNVSITKDESYAAMAALDGRIFMFPIKNRTFENPVVRSPDEAIKVNDIPLSAGIPYTETVSNRLLISLTETSIPYTYSSVNKVYEPPALHPMSGHLQAFNKSGELIWDYYDRSIYSAVSASTDSKWLMAVVDDKKINRQIGYFGFTLFEADSSDFLRKVYRYQTASPVFFRGAISGNGL